jgi:hypothetical protein
MTKSTTVTDILRARLLAWSDPYKQQTATSLWRWLRADVVAEFYSEKLMQRVRLWQRAEQTSAGIIFIYCDHDSKRMRLAG